MYMVKERQKPAIEANYHQLRKDCKDWTRESCAARSRLDPFRPGKTTLEMEACCGYIVVSQGVREGVDCEAVTYGNSSPAPSSSSVFLADSGRSRVVKKPASMKRAKIWMMCGSQGVLQRGSWTAF